MQMISLSLLIFSQIELYFIHLFNFYIFIIIIFQCHILYILKIGAEI